MYSATLEIEIAEATKRYVRREWRLDVSAFKTTRDQAWVTLAGRILEKPGAALAVKRPIVVETRI